MRSKRIPQAYGTALAGSRRRRGCETPITPTLRPSTIVGPDVANRDPPIREFFQRTKKAIRHGGSPAPADHPTIPLRPIGDGRAIAIHISKNSKAIGAESSFTTSWRQ
jgi:hypothetical protein